MDRVIHFSCLVLVFILAACAPPPPADPAALEARATVAAFEAANAAATVDAYYAGQYTATAQVVLAITGTAQAAAATREAESLAATRVAQGFWETREAASAGGTATAIYQIAAIEAQSAAMQATRNALDAARRTDELVRAQNWSAFLRWLPWALLAVVIFAGAAAFALVWRRGRPQTVTANGQDIIIVETPGQGLRPLTPLLPAPALPRLPAPEERPALPPGAAGVNGELPAVLRLPDRWQRDTLGLGATPSRQLWYSQAELGDILGAGEKGSGKSTMVRSLAYQAAVMGWEVRLADAEQLTFNPDVWGEVAAGAAEVETMLASLLGEFDRRFDLFRRAFDEVRRLPQDNQFFVEDLASYNRAAGTFGLPLLRPMLLAWDEANNHVGASAGLDRTLHEVLRRNRKAGLTVAIFGHTWHARQVQAAITTNLTRRIVFRCAERTSRVVIGDPAAARLPAEAKGMALMLEGGRLGRFQSYYLPAERILRDVRPHHRPLSPAALPETDVRALLAAHEQETATSQAEQDARRLATADPARFTSRHQVARYLTGQERANEEAYGRADAALQLLAHAGRHWAAGLLDGSTSTAAARL